MMLRVFPLKCMMHELVGGQLGGWKGGHQAQGFPSQATCQEQLLCLASPSAPGGPLFPQSLGSPVLSAKSQVEPGTACAVLWSPLQEEGESGKAKDFISLGLKDGYLVFR